MRLALLADVHGNLVALEAVLADINRRGSIDGVWVLGDLVALGPNPAGVLNRLSQIKNLVCTRGNTDRYTITGERPPPNPSEIKQNLGLLPVLIEIAGSFAWTQGALTSAGWFEWLANLPVEQRLVLPNGKRLLGVHASPGRDSGCGLHRELSDHDIRILISECDADIICCGHTHLPMDRRVDGIRIVNLGSVSNPLAPDLRAAYAILEATNTKVEISHHRVNYDHQAVIEELQNQNHPGADFIIRHLQGEMTPHLQRPDFPLY